MAQTMTPSAQAQKISNRQIEKAVDILRASFRKHRSEFASDVVQQVLGDKNLGPKLLAVFREAVEEISKMIVRNVKFNPARSNQAILEATRRRQWVDDDVVAIMPRGEGEEGDVYFFKVGRLISDDDLEEEYDRCGLKPADVDRISAVNQDDPAFADDHPNCTHWKDKNGKWCYLAFDRLLDGRGLDAGRGDSDWRGYWWFAGVRK